MVESSFYLNQVSQASNGIAAFAVVQNIGFTTAILSVDGLRKQVVAAKPSWAFVPLAVGIAAYCVLVLACLALELWITDGSLAVIGTGRYAAALAVGRMFGIVFSSIPLVFAILSVRHTANHNATDPA